jgi:hypothetical protein
MPDWPTLDWSEIRFEHSMHRLGATNIESSPAGPSPDSDECVTVVMPVYNAMPFLDAAIASILAQTFSHFLLTIHDDASDDGSYECALKWAAKDLRIKVVRGAKRLGPCGSSNEAARLAQTELVARMDGDDIAMPERLELQLKAMRDHPDAVLVGSTFDMIDGKGRIIRPATPSRIAGAAPPFAHPSIMYRRSAFEATGGYRAGTEYFEDRDLFERMGRLGTLLVINRPLIGLRFAAQHARLRDDRMAVLERVNRQFGDSVKGKRHLSPMAFYAVAVLSIQAHQRPHLLRAMLQSVHFRNPIKTASVMAMVALAELSPKFARAFSQTLFESRYRLSRRRFQEGGVYAWRFGGTDQSP